jgi:hypothetical protein
VRLRDANGTDVDIGTVDRHPACCGVLFFDAPDTATDTISERSPISEPDPNSDDVADPNPDHVADADPSAHIADIADNGDNTGHTSTADGGRWSSGTIRPGGSFSTRFPTAGTFTFHCAIHPNMVGIVIVQ